MSFSRTRIASILFGVSAIGPVGVWLILLFRAVPNGQTALQHAGQMLAYAFIESEAPWFFMLLAISPVLFVVLSIVSWRETPRLRLRRIWEATLGVLATLVAVVVCWPVAITSGMATVYASRRHAA